MTKKSQKTDITVNAKTEEEGQKLMAGMYLSPLLTASHTLQYLEKANAIPLPVMVEVMKEQSEKVAQNDLSALEAMLVAQSYLLHSIFTKATSKLANTEYLNPYQAYGNIALKAQNLCRMTVQTLANMKNPQPTTYIKNTAYNQQVNVGKPSSKASNELLSDDENLTKPDIPQLEEQHHATLDTGGASASGETDKELAAVEEGRREN